MTPRSLSRFATHALTAACLLAVAACMPAGNQATTDADAAPATPPGDDAATGKPALANAAAPINGDMAADSGTLAKWNGYGDMTFGMNEAAFRQAWQGELSDYEFEEKQYCFHLWPKAHKTSAELAFMFNETKFTRYSTENPKLTAPGGGKIGMTRGEIEDLYAGRIERQPHTYVEGGEYLRIANGESVLLFETDATGKVTEWRVGLPPAVDYVEGCM